jgi:hypothetical protein
MNNWFMSKVVLQTLLLLNGSAEVHSIPVSRTILGWWSYVQSEVVDVHFTNIIFGFLTTTRRQVYDVTTLLILDSNNKSTVTVDHCEESGGHSIANLVIGTPKKYGS